MVAAIVLVFAALLVGIWGLARSGQISQGLVPREGKLFSHLLQLSHTLVFTVGILGIMLWFEGHRPNDPLHARVYGPFMVVAIMAAYGYRTRQASTNIKVFAVASLVIFALAIRAFYTN